MKRESLISFLLFHIYFDEILHKLEDSKVCSFTSDLFGKDYAYADDLTLIDQTHNLWKLLVIFESYSIRI